MSAEELTCQELVELVTDYLEAALPASEQARFEAHLAACPGCTTYLAQVRQTIGALGRVPAPPIPDSMIDELLAAFRGWKQ